MAYLVFPVYLLTYVDKKECSFQIFLNEMLWFGLYLNSGLSQVGGWGVPPTQFLADQLTLSQPGGADYTHHITTCHPGFSDLATALWHVLLEIMAFDLSFYCIFDIIQ